LSIIAMIGRCVSAPRASPGAPVGVTLLGTDVALGCGATVGAGGLLVASGASVAGGGRVGALVAGAGAAVGAAAAAGAGMLGWPPQAANTNVPPSSSASRRDGFGGGEGSHGGVHEGIAGWRFFNGKIDRW